MSRGETHPVEVVWEAPREPTPLAQYDDALAEVKKRRGAWARIRIMGSGAYDTRRKLEQKLSGDEHWEVATGKLPRNGDEPERFGVYARYRTEEQLRALKRK